MVAPFISAGLGVLSALGSSMAATVLAKRKLAVVRIQGNAVVGKTFASLDSAKAWQETLAKNGQGSIIVEKVSDGGYVSLNPVRGMTPEGKPVSGEKIKASRGFQFMSRRRNLPAEISRTGGERQFDTLEEQQKVSMVTTRFPTSEAALYQQYGPFPDVIDSRDDVSSHEWKSDVHSGKIPTRFFSDDKFMDQPNEMRVRG